MNKMWRKKDWRKIDEPKVGTHLCIRWFHWSWRPRLYIHCWDENRGSMIHIGIFKSKSNNYVGINGCKNS